MDKYSSFPKLRYLSSKKENQLISSGYKLRFRSKKGKEYRSWLGTYEEVYQLRKEGYYACAYAYKSMVYDCPFFIIYLKKEISINYVFDSLIPIR